jgi:hypothetical protein
MPKTPRTERWEDKGGRTNRVTLVRADRSKPGNGIIRYERQVTVVFSIEEWAVIKAEVFAQHGLALVEHDATA